MFWFEEIEPRHEMAAMSGRKNCKKLRQMVIALQAQIADQQKALAEKDAESENPNIQLDRFPEDGRLELTNNWCESTIRPFATGRRAWLFADTPGGAHTNGIMYTLVLSAQRNQLDEYEYLLRKLLNIGDAY